MLNWPTQRTRVYWKISILSTDNGGFPHVLWTSSNPFLWKLVSMGRYFGSCTVHCLSIGSMEPHLQAASVSCGASSCLPVAWLGQLSHWLLKDTKFFIFSALSQGVSKIFICLLPGTEYECKYQTNYSLDFVVTSSLFMTKPLQQ